MKRGWTGCALLRPHGHQLSYEHGGGVKMHRAWDWELGKQSQKSGSCLQVPLHRQEAVKLLQQWCPRRKSRDTWSGGIVTGADA